VVRYPGDPAVHLVCPPFDLVVAAGNEDAERAGLRAAIRQDRMAEFAQARYPLLDGAPGQSDTPGYFVDRHGVFDAAGAFFQQFPNEEHSRVVHGFASGGLYFFKQPSFMNISVSFSIGETFANVVNFTCIFMVMTSGLSPHTPDICFAKVNIREQ
jgi:hypothetical protein